MKNIVIALFSALICLLSAGTVFSIARINKGAKVNVAWLLMAAGFLFIGIGTAAATLLSLFDLLPPSLADTVYIAPIIGLLLVWFGLLSWHGALKKMLK